MGTFDDCVDFDDCADGIGLLEDSPSLFDLDREPLVEELDPILNLAGRGRELRDTIGNG